MMDENNIRHHDGADEGAPDLGLKGAAVRWKRRGVENR